MITPMYLLSKLIKKAHFPAIRNSIISSKSKVCAGAHVIDVDMDDYSYIGNFSTVINTCIGRYCSIADNCVIGGKSHPMNWVTTSPVSYRGKNCLGINFSNHDYVDTEKTTIENDVWIGNNALIKAGVCLSTGCIIGMGSVVTKNVGPYEIWGGNPAKLIRKRFSEETIQLLLQSKWWELDEELIKNYVEYLDNPEQFATRVISDVIDNNN